MKKAPILVMPLLFFAVMNLAGPAASIAGPREEAFIMAAREARVKGDLDKALELYSHAIVSPELDKEGLASALVERGIIYRVKGMHDLAVYDYTRAIELKPDCAQAYSNRGLAHAKSGRYGSAIGDFTRSLELEPGNAMTYLKRGNAYFDGGDLDRGIADWSKAIVIKPDLMRAYYNRCDAYDRKGMSESAVADCRRALELEPDFQPARAALEWLTGPRKGERPLFSN